MCLPCGAMPNRNGMGLDGMGGKWMEWGAREDPIQFSAN